VIDLLGSVVFATIVGIGVLDMRSGLSPFAIFRSANMTGLGRRAPLTERGGDGNESRPPAPAR
jgi:hypothetical protein